MSLRRAAHLEVASAHLMMAAGTDLHGILDEAGQLLGERYHLVHATLEIEPDDHQGCDQVTW